MIMYTGDLKPDLELTLSSADGVNVDDALSVRIIGKRGDAIVFDRAPTSSVQAGDASVVTMAWDSGDTDTVGRIRVEVEVMWPGDKPQTFRSDGWVQVVDDYDE